MGISNTTSSIRGTGSQWVYGFDKMQANSMQTNRLQATNLNINQATFARLSITNASINTASINSAKINTLDCSGSGLKLSGGNAYINLSATLGTNGYGIRDNSGIAEAKHSGGTWRQIAIPVDRGDPAANDFQVGDLTTDGNWNSLSLAGIVDSGAIKAVIRVFAADDAAGNTIEFRKAGNTNGFNIARLRTQVSNIENSGEFEIFLSATALIEYRATNTTWTSINILVRSWYI